MIWLDNMSMLFMEEDFEQRQDCEAEIFLYGYMAAIAAPLGTS